MSNEGGQRMADALKEGIASLDDLPTGKDGAWFKKDSPSQGRPKYLRRWR